METGNNEHTHQTHSSINIHTHTISPTPPTHPPHTQKPFDVSLLDSVVQSAFSPTSPTRAAANTVLMTIQENPSMWTRADAILESPAASLQSRYFALQVLTAAIKTRWKVMPEEQREGVKGYVVGKVINMSGDEKVMGNREER